MSSEKPLESSLEIQNKINAIGSIVESLYVEKVIQGGYGLATNQQTKKKFFILGALDGEIVNAKITKVYLKYNLAIVDKIIKPSSHRIEPKDKTYLSNSPWQIVDFEHENYIKQQLIQDAFSLNNVKIKKPEIITDNNDFFYRNKYNYSIDDNYNFAVLEQKSHNIVPIKSCSLPNAFITKTSQKIIDFIKKNNSIFELSSKNIKNLLIRSNANGKVLARLYTTTEKINIKKISKQIDEFIEDNKEIIFFELTFFDNFTGKPGYTIYKNGTNELSDKIFNKTFTYGIDSFFQVNQPVYKKALEYIYSSILDLNFKNIVDMFCGIGTIGLSIVELYAKNNKKLPGNKLFLIESDKNSYKYLERNVFSFKNNLDICNKETFIKPILARAEKTYNYINKNSLLLLNPPRAGLHKTLANEILKREPKLIIYLSCNPTTQSRDLKSLEEKYEILDNAGFNFFPRTTHIEHLVILKRKD